MRMAFFAGDKNIGAKRTAPLVRKERGNPRDLRLEKNAARRAACQLRASKAGRSWKGGARERADGVFFCRRQKKTSEQSGLCSDVVPKVGLEPTRYRYQRILSPSRLPIPSHWRWILVYYTRRPPEIQALFRAARPLPRDSGRSFYEVCSSRIIFRRLFRSDR